jgi:hypothetical protein
MLPRSFTKEEVRTFSSELQKDLDIKKQEAQRQELNHYAKLKREAEEKQRQELDHYEAYPPYRSKDPQIEVKIEPLNSSKPIHWDEVLRFADQHSDGSVTSLLKKLNGSPCDLDRSIQNLDTKQPNFVRWRCQGVDYEVKSPSYTVQSYSKGEWTPSYYAYGNCCVCENKAYDYADIVVIYALAMEELIFCRNENQIIYETVDGYSLLTVNFIPQEQKIAVIYAKYDDHALIIQVFDFVTFELQSQHALSDRCYVGLAYPYLMTSSMVWGKTDTDTRLYMIYRMDSANFAHAFCPQYEFSFDVALNFDIKPSPDPFRVVWPGAEIWSESFDRTKWIWRHNHKANGIAMYAPYKSSYTFDMREVVMAHAVPVVEYYLNPVNKNLKSLFPQNVCNIVHAYLNSNRYVTFKPEK